MSNPQGRGNFRFQGAGDELNLWEFGNRQEPRRTNRRVDFGSLGDGIDNQPNQYYPMASHPNVQPVEREFDENETKYFHVSDTFLGYVNLVADNILLHPFLTIRRQCQVNRRSLRHHLTPFTILPIIARLETKQGIGALWKGTASVLLTKGLLMSTESVIDNHTPLAKDLRDTTLTNLVQHLTLKGLSYIVITPFFCSSCIETVQSLIASDSPGFFDCIKEGMIRCTYWRQSTTTRLLPLWIICGSSCTYHLLNYCIRSMLASIISRIYQRKSTYKGTKTTELTHPEYNKVISDLWASLMTSVLLYPLETILNRLYLQGTRTIIDNVDNINNVIPVISAYDGPFDCYKSIIAEEGRKGLFRGFGALLLQYAVHYFIIKTSKLIILQVVPSISKS